MAAGHIAQPLKYSIAKTAPVSQSAATKELPTDRRILLSTPRPSSSTICNSDDVNLVGISNENMPIKKEDPIKKGTPDYMDPRLDYLVQRNIQKLVFFFKFNIFNHLFMNV